MREIKFRGVGMIEQRWFYGFYTKSPSGRTRIIETYNASPIEVFPESVGQFTGLKDKNGKEIYEGDILQLCIPNWTAQEGNELFVIDDFYTDTNYLQAVVEHCEEYEEDYIEVIGNIYENPGLLKGAENNASD